MGVIMGRAGWWMRLKQVFTVVPALPYEQTSKILFNLERYLYEDHVID